MKRVLLGLGVLAVLGNGCDNLHTPCLECGRDPEPVYLPLTSPENLVSNLQLACIQDLFFRKGREEAGEDTTRWFLFEWRDIPIAGWTWGVVSPDSTISTSWGALMTKFCVSP